MKAWKDIQWIFKENSDLMMSSLRDIYVRNTTISDWEDIINLLNTKYKLTFGENKEQIDIEYVKRMFKDKSGEICLKTVIIDLKYFTVNCHFFTVEEIEFDLCAKEITSELQFNVVIDFMKTISSKLGKEIILCDENDSECPLIQIDIKNRVELILSKEEAIMQWKNYYKGRNK